jgi:asparagine synthase (glutamine-hydrolysing)
MCGFAGIWDFEGKIDAELIRDMSAALTHRGPDDAGYHIDPENGVALGHRRLSILDLSRKGRQPMTHGSFRIVYNGEVYNFKEIRSSLETRGYEFQSDTDTEVVLKSLVDRGIDAVKDFRGMFAIALWDEAAREITLIRDRAGVKPLYYHFDGSRFIFASELRAIVMHPEVKKEIDTDALSLYLKLGYVPSPLSIFKNVRKLEPGCFLKLDSRRRLTVDSYWSAWDCYESPSRDLQGLTEEDFLAELEEILRESFRLRMVADVPVGIFLSGGIDSSLVAALLHEECASDLETFSIGFEDSGYDEAADAALVAEHLKTRHHEYTCTADEALAIIPKLPEIYDEPFGDSSAIVTYLVSRFARDHVKVALSADGGDETFAGYVHYLQLGRLYNYFKRYRKLGRYVYGVTEATRLLPLLLSRLANPALKLEKLRELAGIGDSMAEFFLTARSMWTDGEIAALLGLSPPTTRKYGEQLSRHEGNFTDFITFTQAIDYATYLPDDILTKVDRATMAVSLEGREPLLDHHILEFVAAAPVQYKTRKNAGKRPLRTLLRKYLPGEIAEKPKHGFTVPLNKWLRNELAPLLNSHLEQERIVAQGIFSPEMVKTEVERFTNGATVGSTRLWLLLEFELWYEKWMRS